MPLVIRGDSFLIIDLKNAISRLSTFAKYVVGMFLCERHKHIVLHFIFFLKVQTNLLFLY